MLTTNRSAADHLLSGSLAALLAGSSARQALLAGTTAAAAIAASNALVRKDAAAAAAAAAAGVLANKFLGEKMNPYLNDYEANFGGWQNGAGWGANPYLIDEKMAKNMSKARRGGWGAGWGANGGWGCPACGAGWGANGNANRARNALGSPVLKGVLIGAAAAYLLSNKDAKASLINGALKLQNFATAMLEELKEQIEDAKASMSEE